MLSPVRIAIYRRRTGEESSGNLSVIYRLGVYAAYARGVGGFADEELLVDGILQRGLDGGTGEAVLRSGEAQRELLVVRHFEFDFQSLRHVHSSFLIDASLQVDCSRPSLARDIIDGCGWLERMRRQPLLRQRWLRAQRRSCGRRCRAGSPAGRPGSWRKRIRHHRWLRG